MAKRTRRVFRGYPMGNDSMSQQGKSRVRGLTSAEARERFLSYGPNAVPEQAAHAWATFLNKFWAPVPWMLEVTIALQLYSGKWGEAAIISALLLFNAILAFAHESRANHALALLKQRLEIRARVFRDNAWQTIAARELVPGDAVYLRMGDLVPADILLHEGTLLLDQSSLTGEALPVDMGPGAMAHAGTIVRRGEASGEVAATGSATRFGRTAELVRSAKSVSHLEALIFTIVKYLVALDVGLVVLMLIYSSAEHLPLAEAVPFALILLVASVPIALPATYTLATALGALELARHGVLVTRLAAIEEAAAMDVLASDKTGTITQNRLSMAGIHAYTGCTDRDVLRFAALACDEATQDPIDLAILEAARVREVLAEVPYRLSFNPFDPETKRAEAVFEQPKGTLRVMKGAPRIIEALAQSKQEIAADVERLGQGGARVLAVGADSGNGLHVTGLIALHDPPRADSAALIHDLQQLGVRVVMVSGDGPATARAIASQVGIGASVCPPEVLSAQIEHAARAYDIFARVLPEDKFKLVCALQHAGHVVGMSGDGVNDAPALKQAEVGIAVANATDVAKAAASLVLTNPGLMDMKAAVEVSRRVYQRMLTYTLNKVIKTLEIAVFLSVGMILTGVFIITPMLMVLLLFTNDFVTMSIATDRVVHSQKPERWNVPALMQTASPLAALVLALSFAVFYAGRDYLHLPLAQLQTLIFLMLVFTGQGNVYLVRERRHFWQSRPSRWLLLASAADVAMVSLLASQGLLMAAIPLKLIGALLLVVAAYLLVVDAVKVRLFSRVSL